METFITVTILLVSIEMSSVMNRIIPKIPIPLIQIILGMFLSIFASSVNITLDTHLFMVLFIAPLLFNDGKRTPRDELWNLRIPILILSLGLVFITVVVVGFVINKLIPSIPLSAAFALAAILSPTDAVSVNAVASRINLPKGIMRLLEGEALMNDASGLVAFKFAVAAAVSGTFSLGHATLSFFVISIGGILSGVIISVIIIKIISKIRYLGMEDVTFHVLVQILTPFIIYMISEEIGVSGILAVVAGGMVYSIKSDFMEATVSKLKIVSESTWSVILFVINGLVFTILGLEIPQVVLTIFRNDAFNNFKVIAYIFIISALLLLIRFITVFAFCSEKWGFNKKYKNIKSRFNVSMLTALSGARGAVTLVGAFSIPYVTYNGKNFPQRDLIIFIAAGVILVTLSVASFILPMLLKGNADSKKEGIPEKEAFKNVLDSAISTIREEMNEENRSAAMSLISNYKKMIRNEFINNRESRISLKERKIQNEILNLGIEAQRETIKNLYKEGKISEELREKEEEILNREEEHINRKFKIKVIDEFLIIKRVAVKFLFNHKNEEMIDADKIKFIKIQKAKAAVSAIKENITEDNKKVSMIVMEHYNEVIRIIYKKANKNIDEKFNKNKMNLQFKAIQTQRNKVQLLFQNNNISRSCANKLNEFINYIEATTIEDLF